MSNARNLARLLADSSGIISTQSMPSVPGSRVTGTLANSYLPSGSVLQVKSFLNQTPSTATVDLSYWTTVPNMSVVITPIRFNSLFKIDVRWSGEVSSAWDTVFAISRNGTVIGTPTQEGSRMGAVGMAQQSYIDDNNDSTPEYSCFSYIDQPFTNYAITYAMVAKAWSSRTIYTGQVMNGSDSKPYERMSTEIIVTEIAA